MAAMLAPSISGGTENDSGRNRPRVSNSAVTPCVPATYRAASTTKSTAQTVITTIITELARVVTRIPGIFIAVKVTVNRIAHATYGTCGTSRAAVSAA